jgi:hypothetical protein
MNFAAYALASLFIASSAFANSADPAEQDDYRCDGLAGIEEYRVGINLKTSEAWFFDNDMNSYMQLKTVRILESNPPQTEMIFEGEDLGSPGHLRLTFNQTRLRIDLISIRPDGVAKSIGSVSCQALNQL